MMARICGAAAVMAGPRDCVEPGVTDMAFTDEADRNGGAGCKFPAKFRISLSADFRRAFESGSRLQGRYLNVCWTCGDAGTGARLGVTAGKKVLPRSVDRSRAKRLMREVFRLNRGRIRKGCDIVLTARRALRGAVFRDVERDFLSLLGQAGLMEHE